MMSKDSVYTQLESSGKLPVLPEVLLSLLAACEDQDCSISDIADIISRDPALSLRVLQLVNSAYYGCRHSFGGIEQAVIYLGANTVKNLAVTTSVHQVFEEKKVSGTSASDSGRFWYHSLLTATIARRIALAFGGCNADEAYLAGLLHDIGKRLLASAFSEVYPVQKLQDLHGEDKLQLEMETTGLHHCEAGAWLVRQWNLGSLVADAIEYHHEPLDQVGEAFPLVKIVYLANLLANSGQDESQLNGVPLALFGDEHPDISSCVESSSEEVAQVAVSMGIHVSPPAIAPVSASGQELAASGGDRDTIVKDTAHHDHAQLMRATVAARVRNMSLLSTFQEDLMQAEGTDAILAAFEKAMVILFDIHSVLFFLPDREGVLLRCQVSEAGILRHVSQGLSFPLRQSASQIVSAYMEKRQPGYITRDRNGASIADQQILAVLGSDRAYPVPLVVDNRAVGVVVLGLPDGWDLLTEDDRRLVMIIVQQVALRLYVEQEKILKAEALNRERMEAIATTARKLAHEINNPLGIVGNYLVTLRLKLTGETDVLNELAIIDEEIQRISSMVGQMEMYSQAPFSRFEPLDVNAVVRDIIQIAKPSLFNGNGPTVSFIPGTELPLLTTSKDAVKQVLINLLKNAAEAMPDGGRVIVRTRKSQPEGVGDSGGVEVIVADSGPGLPEQVMQNLYKPFITTKQNGHSGLGLSIVQKVVKDIGGKLSCLSSPAEGTTFTIYLPGVLPEGFS
ncbi:HDOD domain-containing protein [Desulfopila aestuarii]|nr:HDOD domain-containing protein [Desulfopila aestuarii]